MTFMWNKQNLSNIWSCIHGKAKQYWGLAEKKSLLIRKSEYF